MKAETVNNCKLLIGCFVVEMLVDGTARLSSIYFVESLTRYDVDRKQASFPFVLTYMIKNLSGPLIGYIEQIVGYKWIITVGCLMATLGVGGCFFAEDILLITLLWGVMLGLSYGLAHNMLGSLMNQCFTDNRSKANGFISSGSCVGGVILPAVISASIKSYGTSGSFLVLSAIVAHTIPACLLIYSSKIKPKNSSLTASNEFSMVKTCECFKNYDAHETSSQTDSNSSCNDYRKTIMNHLKETTAYDSYFSCPIHSVKITTEKVEESETHSKKFTFRYFRIFFDPSYIAILFVNGFNALIITAFWTIILDFVKDKGVPENIEIYYVVLLPITELFGRIGSGYILDMKILTLANYCLIAYLMEAAVLVIFVFIKNYIMLMIFEMLISFFFGNLIFLVIMIAHEFIEENSRKMAMSCRIMLYAPLSFAISPTIGYFKDCYGSYDNVIYILSVLSMFCGCASYLLPHLAKSRRSF